MSFSPAVRPDFFSIRCHIYETDRQKSMKLAMNILFFIKGAVKLFPCVFFISTWLTALMSYCPLIRKKYIVPVTETCYTYLLSNLALFLYMYDFSTWLIWFDTYELLPFDTQK